MLVITEAAARALGGHHAIVIVALPFEQPVEDARVAFVTSPVYADPGAWGIVVNDLVGHLANGYAHEGMDTVAAKARILEIFDAERARPTGRVEWKGQLPNKPASKD